MAAGFTAAGGAAASTVAVGATQHGDGRAQLDRVFVIGLENHSLNSVIGDPNAPYLTSLARQYGEANYYGVTHPSEPNYVAMISGSNWWTNTDNPANRFDHTNLVDELAAAHITWGAYMQALPTDDRWPTTGHRAATRCTRRSMTRSRCSPTSAATRPGWPASSPTPLSPVT